MQEVVVVVALEVEEEERRNKLLLYKILKIGIYHASAVHQELVSHSSQRLER